MDSPGSYTSTLDDHTHYHMSTWISNHNVLIIDRRRRLHDTDREKIETMEMRTRTVTGPLIEQTLSPD